MRGLLTFGFGPDIFARLFARSLRSSHEQSEPGENRHIQCHVGRKAEVVADMPETSTLDVEPAHFRHDVRADEDDDKRQQDRECSGVQAPHDERDATKNFKPWQIKRQPHAERPGKEMIIVDIARKLIWPQRLQDAGVNENSADNEFDDAPKSEPFTGYERYHRDRSQDGGKYRPEDGPKGG